MKIKLPDAWYDFLKWCCILFLPALSVLIKTVCAIWNLPLGDEISTTVMAVDVFLASILGISTIQYNKEKEDGGK